MFCEGCSEPLEMQSVVRQHNRALRSIVRNLRKRVNRGDEKAAGLFISLCETNPLAEQALRELWERAGFQCGPEDYDFVVEVAVRCINQVLGPSVSGASAHRNPVK